MKSLKVVDALWVGLGGACGGVARYWVGDALDGDFPWGILACNLLGSLLLIGVVTVERRLHRGVVHFKAIGFCGSFTTVSTFSLQTVEMIREGAIGRASLYLSVSVLGAMLLIFFGRWLMIRLSPESWHGEAN